MFHIIHLRLDLDHHPQHGEPEASTWREGHLNGNDFQDSLTGTTHERCSLEHLIPPSARGATSQDDDLKKHKIHVNSIHKSNLRSGATVMFTLRYI